MTRDTANATDSKSTEAVEQAVSDADPATPKLADDLLRGAEEIATFLFGHRKHRRKVYYCQGPPTALQARLHHLRAQEQAPALDCRTGKQVVSISQRVTADDDRR